MVGAPLLLVLTMVAGPCNLASEMILKIHLPSLTEPPLSNTSASRVDIAPGAGASRANSTAGGKSPVDLSVAARHLSNLQRVDNDINVARVSEIRAALASGQLKIDPGRVADELIASVRDLLK